MGIADHCGQHGARSTRVPIALTARQTSLSLLGSVRRPERGSGVRGRPQPDVELPAEGGRGPRRGSSRWADLECRTGSSTAPILLARP